MRAGRGGADAALFLVDDRDQYLANRTGAPFAGYPDAGATMGEAIRGAGTAPRVGTVLVTHLGVGLADVVFADAVLRVAEERGLDDPAPLTRARGTPVRTSTRLRTPLPSARPAYSLTGMSPSGSSSTMSSPSTTTV